MIRRPPTPTRHSPLFPYATRFRSAMPTTNTEPGTVVMVGGGAGGLELASRLGGKPGRRRVVLIDRAAYHIWKPSLHEVAAGTLDIHREGLDRKSTRLNSSH